jgi:hypothetical protein
MGSAIKPVAGQEKEASLKPVRLAAFEHDAQLSAEAAEQLLKMERDQNVRAHAGKELNTISEAELLSKIG